MPDPVSEEGLRALLPIPDAHRGREPDVADLTRHLGEAPSAELLAFLRAWGGLCVVPEFAPGDEDVPEGLVMLDVRPGDDVDLFGGSDYADDLFDISALVTDEGVDVRAVSFAWTGADPSEGQLWAWRAGDRSGVAYVDDRAVAHPVADDVFAAVAARFRGAAPFDEEFVVWEDAIGLHLEASTAG